MSSRLHSAAFGTPRDPSRSTHFAHLGERLKHYAKETPDAVAIAVQLRRDRRGNAIYRTRTFRELDARTDQLAAGLLATGAAPGMRVAVLVPFGLDFIEIVFASIKAGIVSILIDPGMGRGNVLACLEEAEPEGFVAVPIAHAIRVAFGGRFPKARFLLTVGRRWFWTGTTLEQAMNAGADATLPAGPTASDPAAIIFTTGSTGPPKGVLYEHRQFVRQTELIQERFDIRPGTAEVAGFPLFALFDPGMGVTCVLPKMDFTRPASVDPENFLAAAKDFSATQSFGSPALWNAVGRHCEAKKKTIPSLEQAFSAGAPVPAHVLVRLLAAMRPGAQIWTPYGATEALPVATISSKDVLGETAVRSREGAGTCVGSRFPGIEWRVIRIDDGPLPDISQTQEVSRGEIGELMVRGDVVTREYVTRTAANALHKVTDGDGFWHRMGDVGWLDEEDRFWFCGRKSHRVVTNSGTHFTIPCEAIANGHPHVYRSALVGIGPPDDRTPAIVVEPWPEHRPRTIDAAEELVADVGKRLAAHPLTRSVRYVLIKHELPVDIRHNSKIFRERLAVWAERELKSAKMRERCAVSAAPSEGHDRLR